MKRYLTPKELAVLLNISLHQVYKLVQTNIIPHFRLGGKIMFDIEQIEAFIRDGGRGYHQ